GKNQDSLSGIIAENLACRIETIELGHANVENDDVRLQLLCFFHGHPTVSSLTTHLPSSMCLQQFANTPAYYLVVVCDQDSELVHRAVSTRIEDSYIKRRWDADVRDAVVHLWIRHPFRM